MRKFFAALLAISIAITGVSVYAFNDDNDITTLDSALEYFGDMNMDPNFGGMYFDEAETLIINIVEDGSPFAFHPKSESLVDAEIEYRIVEHPLAFLESAKDFLAEKMIDYSISVLDANEVTNVVDVYLMDYREEVINEITEIVENVYPGVPLNFIDSSSQHIVSTVATEKPNYVEKESIILENSIARTIIAMGSLIQIGSGYYTMGPIVGSYTGYSAGHGFNGTENVYDHLGLKCGTATSHFGGSNGDWSLVSLTSQSVYTVSTKRPVSGQSVMMWGAVSGKTNGKITSTNVTINSPSIAPYVPLSGMCAATYECALGDSGAGVFTTDWPVTTTFGVQSCMSADSSGNWAGTSYFTPATKFN